MTQQIELNWEQELLARGEARGRLMMLRQILQEQLQKRFGELPEALLQRLAAADLPTLKAAWDQTETLTSLNDLRL